MWLLELERSTVSLIVFHGYIQGPQKVKYGMDNVVTAKDIIIATGSVPMVPKGIEVDGKLLFLCPSAIISSVLEKTMLKLINGFCEVTQSSTISFNEL